MKQYVFEDYNEYIKAQIEKTNRCNDIWVKPSELKIIANHIKKYIPNAKRGICHGVRTGYESQELSRLLGIEVLGTDLLGSEGVIPWDFHDLNPNWINSFDFVYSNALDHAFNADKCLFNWMRSLKSDGLCFIHWEDENSSLGKDFNQADCFVMTNSEMHQYLSSKYIVSTLPCLIDNKISKDRVIFVLRKVNI
jgi:hypothetical protein